MNETLRQLARRTGNVVKHIRVRGGALVCELNGVPMKCCEARAILEAL